VQGSGCRVWGLRFCICIWSRVEGLKFTVQSSAFRVQSSAFRVQGAGFRVQGSGVRDVPGTRNNLVVDVGEVAAVRDVIPLGYRLGVRGLALRSGNQDLGFQVESSGSKLGDWGLGFRV